MKLTPLKHANKSELLALIDYLTTRQFDRAQFVRDLEYQLTDLRLAAAMKEMDAISERLAAMSKQRANLTGIPLMESLIESRRLHEEFGRLNELTNKLMQIGKYEVKEAAK